MWGQARFSLVVVTGLAAAVFAEAAGASARGPVLARSQLRPARYCGTYHLHGAAGPAEIHAVPTVRCRVAVATIRASLQLPPIGNGPGDPPGWQCFRITGAPPSGIACSRSNHDDRLTVAAIGAPSGSVSRRFRCADGPLYARDGIAGIAGHGMTCDVALNTIGFWASEWGATTTVAAGPTGYRCQKRRRYDFVRYVCRRGDRVINFNLGGG